MEIKVYSVELDATDRHPVLVAEDIIKSGESTFNSPCKVAELCSAKLRMPRMAEEQLWMLASDTAGHPLGMFRISHGTVNSSWCSPREIFIRALAVGAVSIILIHNHPSGSCDPSDADKAASERIRKSGQLIGIKVSDFIIVGDGYYSFLEQGILK